MFKIWFCGIWNLFFRAQLLTFLMNSVLMQFNVAYDKIIVLLIEFWSIVRVFGQCLADFSLRSIRMVVEYLSSILSTSIWCKHHILPPYVYALCSGLGCCDRMTFALSPYCNVCSASFSLCWYYHHHSGIKRKKDSPIIGWSTFFLQFRLGVLPCDHPLLALRWCVLHHTKYS